MKTKLTLWAACLAAAGILTGCHCQAVDQPSKAAPKPAQEPTAAKPMKAQTQDGQVVWIVAVWNADEIPCNADQSPCKTAQCWKTKDGRTICVKPLKDCPAGQKHCPKGACFKCGKTGKIMTTENNPAKVNMKKPCAAKQITPCPKNGSAKCGAESHVTMADGKPGCAKADHKQTAAQKNQKAPVNMGDAFVEDDVFLISAID